MSQTTAENYLHLPRRRYFSALEWHAVAIGSIAAAVLIIGYGFNFEPLQTLVPSFPTMKARTAAALATLLKQRDVDPKQIAGVGFGLGQ